MTQRTDTPEFQLDRPPPMSRHGRILLLLGQRENRRILAEWLAGMSYHVTLSDSPEALRQGFDLCILDGPMLDPLVPWVQAIKKAQLPVFLPFLLVTHRHDVGLATQHLWQSVDELIVSPTEKGELRARVEAMLTARELSIQNTLLRRQLEAEMTRAGRVQAELLPKSTPWLDGFDLAGRCVPAREVGGDFYDWKEIAPGALWLAVGDVMGKGLSAALLTATVRATLRAVCRSNAPAAAVELLRQAMEPDLLRTDRYVTLFLGRLDAPRRRMNYVDAGHGFAFLRRTDGAIEMLKQGGKPVGVPSIEGYREGVVEFRPGEALVVYSDGLVEIKSEDPVDPATLSRQLDGMRTAEEMVQRLVESARLAGPPPDDLTAVVLRCKPV